MLQNMKIPQIKYLYIVPMHHLCCPDVDSRDVDDLTCIYLYSVFWRV